MTFRCWPQDVRLDLHDSRQLKWLHRHIAVGYSKLCIPAFSEFFDGLPAGVAAVNRDPTLAVPCCLDILMCINVLRAQQMV